MSGNRKHNFPIGGAAYSGHSDCIVEMALIFVYVYKGIASNPSCGNF